MCVNKISCARGAAGAGGANTSSLMCNFLYSIINKRGMISLAVSCPNLTPSLGIYLADMTQRGAPAAVFSRGNAAAMVFIL